ncbi:MAG: tagaturonate epimerase family protein [Spirochaetales bacterium]|nr:tagaturonate epimerase family protein [Spirochaetales bacterium]
MKKIAKYSIGTGDRFAFSAPAQLAAVAESGAAIVWNKSNREHLTIHSSPDETRRAGEDAVAALGYKGEYHFDADHIKKDTVQAFIDHCDFFTLDVADFIGKPVDPSVKKSFLDHIGNYLDRDLSVAGFNSPVHLSRGFAEDVADTFLAAVVEAEGIYKKILASGHTDDECIIEISMDETEKPQSPSELLIILMAVAWMGIPVQTIAPKFSGRFNKGVDYVGNPEEFAREFEDDVLVIAYGVKEFDLPANLKLSVHSGSDKFVIYPHIRRVIEKYNTGLHIKTAGTSWLAEVIGLARSGGEALDFVKKLYEGCLGRIDELCAPYADVIDIDTAALPSTEITNLWTGEEFARALDHNQADEKYNPNMRQLVHVGYKLAAEQKDIYMKLLKANRDNVFSEVKRNLLDRHIAPLFL